MAGKRDRPKALDAIAMTVTFVWALAVIAQIIDPSREVPGTVHYIMGALVSALFGISAISKRNGNGS